MTAHDRVTLGVDTHADTHTAAIVDVFGRVLAHLVIAATGAGYAELVAWARSFGEVTVAGVEGTGCYGAGLARHLSDAGIAVLEVNRPNRQLRRRYGKSDSADAHAAALAVLAGHAAGPAKIRRGAIEAIRNLHLVRRSAVKNQVAAGNQIKDLVVTAPEPIAEQLRGLKTPQRVKIAASWTHASFEDPTIAACAHAIGMLARRWRSLAAEIKELETLLEPLIQDTAPTLYAEHGVGLDVAAKLLIAVGENPERLRNEASFAALCGTSPVDASSGKHTHHRLNRGGNRQANNALHTVWLTRARSCDETRTYIETRTANGRTRRCISRSIKRALARRFYHLILADLTRPLT